MCKVRVLHMFNSMNRGGAETFIMNVYRNIDRNKISFEFLCNSSEKGSFDEEIKSLGGKVYHLNYNKRRPFNNLIKLFLFLRREGPFDVIHLPVMFYSGFVCIIAKFAGIKKIIVHSHNAGETCHNGVMRKIYRKVMRFFINNFSDYKLSCGIDAAKFLFGNINNVKIINNGIDVDYFQTVKNKKELLKEFNIKDEFVIGNIARFVPEKNHSFFIDLALFFKKNNINAKIILVGDGKLRADIEKCVKDNEIQKFILFTGVRSDVHNLLHIFDVLLMPSIHEGFPVTVIEALAAGVPCLLSNNIDKNVAIIKEMVSFLELSNNSEMWYNEALKISKTVMSYDKIKDIISDSGFDIKTSTKLLEDIYLE